MEFLMTYGWAILIMLVVIAVLFYLGVFSPSTSVPKICTLPAGLACYDYSIDLDGNLNLDLGQALGRDITVTGVGCDPVISRPTLNNINNVNISTGAHSPVVGVNSTNSIQCCLTSMAACRFRLAIRYNFVGKPSPSYTVYGDVSAPKENIQGG
jgi:hypothetical protein